MAKFNWSKKKFNDKNITTSADNKIDETINTAEVYEQTAETLDVGAADNVQSPDTAADSLTNSDEEPPEIIIEESESELTEPAQSIELAGEAQEEYVPAPTVSVKMKKLSVVEDGSVVVNKFDLFWIKIWSAITAGISAVGDFINKGIHFVFKKRVPGKYMNAFLGALLIILLIILITAPFNVTVQEEETFNVYGDNRLPVKTKIGHIDGEPVYKWGYADKDGELIIDCVYEEALPFYHGAAFVRIVDVEGDLVDDYWALINKKGTVISKQKFKDDMGSGKRPVGQFTAESKLAWVNIGGKYGFISNKGKIEIDAKYDYAETFSEGLARVRLGYEEFFIDDDGDIKGGRYDEVISAKGGLCAVKRNNLWGFANLKGKVVIDPSYDEVSSFYGGYATVKRGITYGIIDSKGEYIVPLSKFNDFNAIDEIFNQLIKG